MAVTAGDIRQGKAPKASWTLMGEALGIKRSTVSSWQKDPACPRSKGGVVDVVEVCEWLIATRSTGRGASTATVAASILSKLKGFPVGIPRKSPGVSRLAPAPAPAPILVPQEPSELPEVPVPESIPPYVSKMNQERGLEAALDRARYLELELALKYEEQVMEDDPQSAATFSQWQKVIETLRKVESDILDVLQKRKTLVRYDEAVRLFNRHVIPVKNAILLLPTLLANELENRDATEIKEILEERIRKTVLDFVQLTASEGSEASTEGSERIGGVPGAVDGGVEADEEGDREAVEANGELEE